MADLLITVASGAQLIVTRFEAHESISEPFSVGVWARIADPTLDLEAITGHPASFTAAPLDDAQDGGGRTWTGVVSFAQIGRTDDPATGVTSYFFRIVPRLWLLTQRRGLRLFQHRTVPQIIDALLGEWSVDHAWTIDASAYPPLELKTQWRETDYDFFTRLLEEAGIAYYFDQRTSQLQLVDAPHMAPPRDGSPVRWTEAEAAGTDATDYLRAVGVQHEVRPGKYTFRDSDLRRPSYALFGSSLPAPSPEDAYEQYVYGPGAFSADVALTMEDPTFTPNADDRGAVRHDDAYGKARAQRALEAERAGRRSISFDANFIDVGPGTVLTVDQHPLPELGPTQAVLVTEITITGEAKHPIQATGRAAFATEPWRPLLVTPKPRVRGIQSATVVGPSGEEIHTDELGRVRVQFPWDREGGNDANSSCWMRVSQGWGGLGYGFIALPRVGHEVLVDFIDGDPDFPVVMGRVFNFTAPVPYKLPDDKTISTWKSDTSPGSGGYNEILYDDRAGQELVSTQAELNQRKLVKNDETITVGADRTKYVLVHETDTTGANRVEVTGGARTQIDGGNRIIAVGGDKERLVLGERTTVTEGAHMRLALGDMDSVLKGTRRERIEVEAHQNVVGDRREKIAGDQALAVGDDRVDTVGGSALFSSAQAVHFEAGTSAVLDGADDLTLKGAGGFIRIDGGGVTIVGAVVQINAGGSPGSAPSANPLAPSDATEAKVDMPQTPVTPPLPPPPPESNWIEIALADEDDPAVGMSFARYRVSGPNGQVIDGRLDASGRARVLVTESGSCSVTFPDLDAGTWAG